MRLHTKVSLIKSTIRIVVNIVSAVMMIRVGLDSPLFVPIMVFLCGNIFAEVVAIVEEVDDK